MKKIFSLLMTVVVLLSALSLGAGNAGAAGIITYRGGLFVLGKGIAFVFDASGFRNRDVKNASIFVGSNFHDLYCTANKDEGKIVCVARGILTEYGGQTGIIHLAGQIFYVTVPGTELLVEKCEAFEVLGALVTFELSGGEDSSEEFIAGESLQEVASIASGMVNNDPVTGYHIGEFGCTELEVEVAEEVIAEEVTAEEVVE